MLWPIRVALEALTDVGITGVVGGRAHIGGTTVAPRVDATISSDVFLIKDIMLIVYKVILSMMMD